jgi:hypothetical protein
MVARFERDNVLPLFIDDNHQKNSKKNLLGILGYANVYF